jgi:hypothetical protein
MYDEKDVGMDPQTKRYFLKIVNSFAWGVMWLMFVTFFGLYFGLAYAPQGLTIVNIIFYVVVLMTLLLLLRYLYRSWKP